MTTTLIDDTFNVGTRDGASANAYEIHFLVEVARQDVAANKSYLNITKTYKGINRWAWNQTAGTDTISGAVSSSVTITQVYPTATVITVQSLTEVPVSHNSDGTLNTTINTAWSYGSVYNQYMAKEYSKSYNVDLPPIPRASVLSLNKTSVNLNTSSGNAISYTITPYSSSFTHKIIWALGSGGNTINNATNGSLTYSQLLSALSSSANGTLSITLQTYSGSTLVGSNSASVPVSVDLTVFKPTLNVENIVVNSTPVTAATIKNYLIAGITTAKFYSTATKPDGAASVTTTFTASHGTLSASSTTSTTRQEITTNTLPSNETDGYTLTITVKATDSRGASVTVTKTATVYAYKKPTVTLEAYRVADSTSTNRDDGGSWVYVTFTSTLGATVNGQNSIQSTTCTYTGSISGTATNGAHIALTDSQNATFTVVATDKVSSSNLSVIVPTATYPFDLYYDDNEGNGPVKVGVGLGGLAIPDYIKPYLPIVDVEQNYLVNIAGTDLNDYREAGIYYFTSNYTPTNIPVGVNGWLMVLKPPGDAHVKQIWFRQGTNGTNDFDIYVRQYSASAWSSWTKLLTANDTVTATNSHNIGMTNTNPTSSTTYYPIFTNATSGWQPGRANNGLSYYTREGTASDNGFAVLKLGNTTDSGTAGNKYGLIDIYPKTGAYYGRFTTASTLTANRTYTLPNASGTVLLQAANNYVSLVSTTVSSSATTATFTGANYSAYCIVGAEGRGYRSSIIVPRALITTTEEQWMVTFYGASSIENVRFGLKASAASGGTITLTWKSGKTITQVYGIK